MQTTGPTFYQSISFQLAKIGILLAFALSFILSSIQIYIDYQSQRQEFNQLANRVIAVATPPASRAVHTLDNALATEVVNGLMKYDFIYQVAIKDERGKVLAQKSRRRSQPEHPWLTKLLSGDKNVYSTALAVAGYTRPTAGELMFKVDIEPALAGFYQRCEFNLTVGILRNLLLVGLLFVAFYFKLTRPLVRLSREVNQIDPSYPGAQRLTSLGASRKDELSTVIVSANKQLDVIELELAKRRTVELALRNSEEHLRQIVDSLPVMIGARNRQGRYLFANKALASSLGHTPQSMHNMHLRDLLKGAVVNVEAMLENDRQVIEQHSEIDVMEEAFIRADGSHLYLQTHMLPLSYYTEQVSLIVSMDITERKNAQAKMEYMAHHDALTNLPNRLQLVNRLEHEVRRALRHGYFGAVLFIDLDKFKNINDSLGHPVGDKLLQAVAQRLKSAVREEDLVARLSGDEFIVVLTVLDQNLDAAALKAGEVGEKIRAIIAQPCLCDDMELRVTCSVGVVVYPDKNYVVHELLRYADTAMYQVKEKGRDAIAFFNEGMADQVNRQLVMEGDLLKAIEAEEFELFYQPKIDVTSGKIMGAEGLLRWCHPDKGYISPAEFIPILETSGLILQVGQWVVEQACQQLEHWQAQQLWQAGARLSVNISPRQFRQECFAQNIINTLNQYQLPANALDMEITEGIVIQHVEEAVSTMRLLADHGISFSLDDFGTGYSSISYLKRLPVSTLKIDQSFIRDILDDRNDRVLVETIVTMGRLLDLELVAEGVEQEEQLQMLRDYHCHLYQGYLFSPAIKADDFSQLLRNN